MHYKQVANWGKEEVANWGKGEMPLCSRTQWNFESLADQNSEILCWRFQFCAQLTPSNEKYWQKRPRKFYSQAIWPSFSRPSTQEGRGTWLQYFQLTTSHSRCDTWGPPLKFYIDSQCQSCKWDFFPFNFYQLENLFSIENWICLASSLISDERKQVVSELVSSDIDKNLTP